LSASLIFQSTIFRFLMIRMQHRRANLVISLYKSICISISRGYPCPNWRHSCQFHVSVELLSFFHFHDSFHLRRITYFSRCVLGMTHAQLSQLTNFCSFQFHSNFAQLPYRAHQICSAFDWARVEFGIEMLIDSLEWAFNCSYLTILMALWKALSSPKVAGDISRMGRILRQISWLG
jgi:hypothetical protein